VSGLEEMSREELIALSRALLAENARLAERVAVLEKENAELRERVARLERLISRNSGNSGMPPANDDLPGKAQPKAKPACGGKRRPGKQPGAPGTTLAWADEPDETVDHFPSGACACGADLARAADLGVTARHQQVEVPLMTATTIQHNLHTVACGCGKVHAALMRLCEGTGIVASRLQPSTVAGSHCEPRAERSTAGRGARWIPPSDALRPAVRRNHLLRESRFARERLAAAVSSASNTTSTQ
jgi:hypothetical protein